MNGCQDLGMMGAGGWVGASLKEWQEGVLCSDQIALFPDCGSHHTNLHVTDGTDVHRYVVPMFSLLVSM